MAAAWAAYCPACTVPMTQFFVAQSQLDHERRWRAIWKVVVEEEDVELAFNAEIRDFRDMHQQGHPNSGGLRRAGARLRASEMVGSARCVFICAQPIASIIFLDPPLAPHTWDANAINGNPAILPALYAYTYSEVKAEDIAAACRRRGGGVFVGGPQPVLPLKQGH
ncbi:hypothetical protein B0H13DRAFT_1881571 [Mycena leptocephala]|nr:hypothetical protein B0H13DRAFT_1881571 [Mycena leptocephala]